MVQYFFIFCIYLMRLFLCCWAAEMMTDTVNSSIISDNSYTDQTDILSLSMKTTLIVIFSLFLFQFFLQAYEVSWRIYDTPWIYATPQVRRNVCMIMQRCQKVVSVKATSVIPVMSISFFGKVKRARVLSIAIFPINLCTLSF